MVVGDVTQSTGKKYLKTPEEAAKENVSDSMTLGGNLGKLAGAMTGTVQAARDGVLGKEDNPVTGKAGGERVVSDATEGGLATVGKAIYDLLKGEDAQAWLRKQNPNRAMPTAVETEA